MTSNEFIAKEINRIWLERIERWQNQLLQIYGKTMTKYNARQIRMVLDEIQQIQEQKVIE